MKDYSFSRIKLHANFLNSLLEDRNTPKAKIKFETIMLANMLEKFRRSKAKVPTSEMESIYKVLKKVQPIIEEDITSGGSNHEQGN